MLSLSSRFRFIQSEPIHYYSQMCLTISSSVGLFRYHRNILSYARAANDKCATHRPPFSNSLKCFLLVHTSMFRATSHFVPSFPSWFLHFIPSLPACFDFRTRSFQPTCAITFVALSLFPLVVFFLFPLCFWFSFLSQWDLRNDRSSLTPVKNISLVLKTPRPISSAWSIQRQPQILLTVSESLRHVRLLIRHLSTHFVVFKSSGTALWCCSSSTDGGRRFRFRLSFCSRRRSLLDPTPWQC